MKNYCLPCPLRGCCADAQIDEQMLATPPATTAEEDAYINNLKAIFSNWKADILIVPVSHEELIGMSAFPNAPDPEAVFNDELFAIYE